MSGRDTERLLQDLSRDLRPVRRLPPLHVATIAVVAVWLAGTALHWLAGFPRPRFGAGGGWDDPVYVAIFAGLVLASAAGVVSALARGIPGREGTAALGAWVLLLGLVLATGAALSDVFGPGRGGLVATATASLPCVGRSLLLALAPAALACAFLVRAWERRPGSGGFVVALTGLALGAIAVHASCVTGDALHMLLGHAAGTVVAAALLALPAAGYLRARLRT